MNLPGGSLNECLKCILRSRNGPEFVTVVFVCAGVPHCLVVTRHHAKSFFLKHDGAKHQNYLLCRPPPSPFFGGDYLLILAMLPFCNPMSFDSTSKGGMGGSVDNLSSRETAQRAKKHDEAWR